MTPNTSSSPAAEVWRRLIGMYGADTVARKYGQSIPDEWIAMLSRLDAYQIQRGVRMLAYSGKQNVPSLPEFVKLCRDAEHDRETTSQPALPNPDKWQGDGWDSEANLHLLGYITRKIPENPQRYGRPCSYLAMKDPMRMKDKTLDALPEFVANVGLLVSFKNAWARDMREGFLDAATGEIKSPTIEQQKSAWKDCMERAEAAIAQKAAA